MPTDSCNHGGMDKTQALARARAAYDAIAAADEEAKRIKREARLKFGVVVNELTESKYVMQEEVASEIGRTREYVRRLQVDARQT